MGDAVRRLYLRQMFLNPMILDNPKYELRRLPHLFGAVDARRNILIFDIQLEKCIIEKMHSQGLALAKVLHSGFVAN